MNPCLVQIFFHPAVQIIECRSLGIIQLVRLADWAEHGQPHARSVLKMTSAYCRNRMNP